MQEKVNQADLEIANMTMELAKKKEEFAKISEGVDKFTDNTRTAATEQKIRTELDEWAGNVRSDILGSFRDSGSLPSGPPEIGHPSAGKQASVEGRRLLFGSWQMRCRNPTSGIGWRSSTRTSRLSTTSGIQRSSSTR